MGLAMRVVSDRGWRARSTDGERGLLSILKVGNGPVSDRPGHKIALFFLVVNYFATGC